MEQNKSNYMVKSTGIKKRTVIFISGNGSNMKNLIRFSDSTCNVLSAIIKQIFTILTPSPLKMALKKTNIGKMVILANNG